MSEGNRPDKNQVDALSMLLRKIGGNVDGGIRDSAWAEYSEWVRHMRTELEKDLMKSGCSDSRGGRDNIFLCAFSTIPLTVIQAFDTTTQSYNNYVVARDWAEFAAAGREPAGLKDAKVYAVSLWMRYMRVRAPGMENAKMPSADAMSAYRSMADALGDDHLRSVAQRIHDAPKDKDGFLARPEALGLTPARWANEQEFDKGPNQSKFPAPEGMTVIGIAGGEKNLLMAFQTLAASSDAHRYLLGVLASPDSNRPYSEWGNATVLYRKYVLAYGEETVLMAADRVRKARTSLAAGIVIDNEENRALHLGVGRPYWVFPRALPEMSPRGYVRAFFVFGQDMNSEQAVNASYHELVAKYGEKKVLDAAQTLFTRLGSEGNLFELEGMLDGSFEPLDPKASLIDHPEYVNWRGFEPGATVTVIAREYTGTLQRMVPGPPRYRSTKTLGSINDNRAELTLTEISYFSGRANPPNSRELEYPAKTTPDARQPPTQREGVLRESGTETLEIGGKKILCRWESTTYTTYVPGGTNVIGTDTTKEWTSDEVPGGFVRRTVLSKRDYGSSLNETVVESFQGVRKDKPAPSQEPSAANANPVPGRVASSSPSPAPQSSPRLSPTVPASGSQPAVIMAPPATTSAVPAYKGPLSGRLSYNGSPVPQNAEIVFNNLPPGRLSLVYDTANWSARIVPGENGTQRLILRSKRPGTQNKAEITWSITK